MEGLPLADVSLQTSIGPSKTALVNIFGRPGAYQFLQFSTSSNDRALMRSL